LIEKGVCCKTERDTNGSRQQNGHILSQLGHRERECEGSLMSEAKQYLKMHCTKRIMPFELEDSPKNEQAEVYQKEYE
jgi:hypothetical protein